MDGIEEAPRYDLAKFVDNPVEFLNEHFTDECNFADIDALIAEVKGEMRQQDCKLMEVINDKAISIEMAHERFEKLQCATNDLIAQMAEIQIPTMRGEQSLKILTADIRALNHAKNNICNTITNLKRILMLSTMLESLREKAKNRKYNEAAGLAVVVRELYQLVTPLREAPPVVRLLTACKTVMNNLKQQITEDLEVMLALSTTQKYMDTPLELEEVCKCADAIDEGIRQHIATKYAQHVTKSYESMFSTTFDLKTLDNINERFAWLRRTINEFDELYGTGVPEFWRIQATGAWAFFEACRSQVVATLTRSKEQFDANVILTSLLRCKEFEQELDYRLSNYCDTPTSVERQAIEFPEAVPSPRQTDEPDTEQRKPLKGVLSRCFENHLGPWVANEEVQLDVLYQKIVSNGDDAIIMHVLRSAKELFSAISVRLKAVLAVSSEQTLFEMSMVFRRSIGKYQVHLQDKLGKVEKHAPLQKVFKQCGFITATCDYVTEMLEHLNDEIVEAIAPAYKEKVHFNAEKEKINVTKSKAVKRLIDESCKFAPITPNVVAPLKSLEERVIQVITLTVDHLPSGYLHYVTNKVTRGAMAHLKTTIFSLASVTEGYCQQLLLDSYSLQKLLLETVKTLVDPLPLGYLEATSSEMDKLQTLIKVLNSAASHTDAFEALLIENGGTCTKKELDQILAIHRKK